MKPQNYTPRLGKVPEYLHTNGNFDKGSWVNPATGEQRVAASLLVTLLPSMIVALA